MIRDCYLIVALTNTPIQTCRQWYAYGKLQTSSKKKHPRMHLILKSPLRGVHVSGHDYIILRNQKQYRLTVEYVLNTALLSQQSVISSKSNDCANVVHSCIRASITCIISFSNQYTAHALQITTPFEVPHLEIHLIYSCFNTAMIIY